MILVNTRILALIHSIPLQSMDPAVNIAPINQ